MLFLLIERIKGRKGHESGKNSEEVWAVGGEGIDAEGGKAAQLLRGVDGPDAEFEAVLVGDGGHSRSEEAAVHIDPVATEGGSLADQDFKGAVVAGIPDVF